MKTRNGFVSNSSSSSFIVAIPEVPKTIEDTMVMLFGKNWKRRKDRDIAFAVGARVFSDIFFKTPSSITASNYLVCDLLDYATYTTRVLKKIINTYKKPLTKIIKRENQLDEKYGDWWDYKREITEEEKQVRQKLEDKRIAILREAASAIVEELEKYGSIYIFEYADDRGEAVLEQEKIFKRLEYIQISHH